MQTQNRNRRSVRAALIIAVMSLAIVAGVAYAASPKPLPVEPNGGAGGGEVVLPVEPDGGIGN